MQSSTVSKKYGSTSLLLFICLFICGFFFSCGLRDEHQKVADVFLSRKSSLNHHTAYITQFDRNLALLDEMCLKYSQVATMIQEFEVRLTRWVFLHALMHGFPMGITQGFLNFFFLVLHQCSHIE